MAKLHVAWDLCNHGTARPQVAVGETASRFEYIEKQTQAAM
jgi:hypothetical protein